MATKTRATNREWRINPGIQEFMNHLDMCREYCRLALFAATPEECYCMLGHARYWLEQFPERSNGLFDLLELLEQAGVNPDCYESISGVSSRELEAIEKRCYRRMEQAEAKRAPKDGGSPIVRGAGRKASLSEPNGVNRRVGT